MTYFVEHPTASESTHLLLYYYCSTASAMSLFLAHSGQRMSSLSVMNPLPTMEVLQEEQRKQSLCQCRPSKEMKRVPPMPDGEGSEREILGEGRLVSNGAQCRSNTSSYDGVETGYKVAGYTVCGVPSFASIFDMFHRPLG